MNDNIEMTTFSQRELEYILKLEISPSEVIDYFYEGLCVRHFGEVLTVFGGGKDVRKQLIDICEIDGTVKRDSIRKNVSNWLNNKNAPTDRDELIKLCFALEIDENKACAFMSYASDGSFHLRNPREIAFLYCLRVGKSYKQAIDFVNKLRPVDFTKFYKSRKSADFDLRK